MLKTTWKFLVQIFDEWIDDKAPKLAAALSFYTIFSMAPLVLISISVAGLVFGEAAAQGRIVNEIETFVGKEGAILIQRAVMKSNEGGGNIIATIIGLITLFIGASAVFVELQDSLNLIWKVRQKPGRPLKTLLRNRIISFILVIGMGLLLFALLLVSSLIEGLTDLLSKYLSIPGFVFTLTDIFISLSIVVILFSMIYKVLPDVYISWKDVRIGAFVTSILFIIGKYLITIYLGKTSYSSVFGAAGSLALIILWIYYSAQVIFLGAEFTYIYSLRMGSGIHPKENAELIR